MRYASLASSSKGNCHAISDGEKILLIDAGISHPRIVKSLKSIDWNPDLVRGVAITHEHRDHISGIRGILKKTNWKILATPITLDKIEKIMGVEVPKERWNPLKAGLAEDWEGWRLCPFEISHDAEDPVAYRIEAGGVRLAVITDLGCVTELVIECASDLELLVLESNHDIGMVLGCDRPDKTKARILDTVGHLSNDACAGLLSKVLLPTLRHVVLAHLSEENNDPFLARLAATYVINRAGSSAKLHVASRDEVLEVMV
ncbi:MAG: MBL fold metallo-hydrolase [Holophagales bacterium]|jgi:phosphoribosyl 1,2-cyclic phosphodiesterase|nr:MBL fold metallo-hydrolase [Holophagales bacterium]